MTGASPHDLRLTLKGAGVARGGRAVLAGIDFDLRPGEVVLLKGPNGSGKTSLLRSIAGLGALEGVIDPSNIEERRRRIIYCGHADGVKSGLTVAETLRFWANVYGAPDERIGEAVAALALQGLEQRRTGTLSAGQKRRLGLARLVVADKAVWLLDEPAASIDAASVERLIALVTSHAARGGSALIATHDRLVIPGARAVLIEARG